MTGLVWVTGEGEGEELLQDIVGNGGLEEESDGVGWRTGIRALQVPVSILVR